MPKEIFNKKLLFISKSKAAQDLLSVKSSPSVTLLTLQQQSSLSDFQKLEPLVTRLLSLGCRSFVCAGKYSESLHDFIDEVIVSTTTADNKACTEFLTTWHTGDTNDEIADFFLHSPSWSDELKLAIFDDDSLEDQNLKKAVKRLTRKFRYY